MSAEGPSESTFVEAGVMSSRAPARAIGAAINSKAPAVRISRRSRRRGRPPTPFAWNRAEADAEGRLAGLVRREDGAWASTGTETVTVTGVFAGANGRG